MNKRQITEKLIEKGMAWAVRSDKYTDPNDPLEDQVNRRKTWHIHPNASYPHQNDIVRFDTLAEIEEWIE